MKGGVICEFRWRTWSHCALPACIPNLASVARSYTESVAALATHLVRSSTAPAWPQMRELFVLTILYVRNSPRRCCRPKAPADVLLNPLYRPMWPKVCDVALCLSVSSSVCCVSFTPAGGAMGSCPQQHTQTPPDFLLNGRSQRADFSLHKRKCVPLGRDSVIYSIHVD